MNDYLSRLRLKFLSRFPRVFPEVVDHGVIVANIQGFFLVGDVLAYRSLVERLPAGSVVVEVGTWMGKSIINVAKYVPADLHYLAIDTFMGSAVERDTDQKAAKKHRHGVYFRFLRNILRYNVGNVSILKMASADAVKFFNNGFAGMVFIDAGHTYPEVVSDINIWLPKVIPGGILAGHDYWEENDVVKAVRDTLPGRCVETFPDSRVWAIQV